MLKRLFKKKDKIEEIEEMILHLRQVNKLDALGGIGRDWYSANFLMRGNGTASKDYILKNNKKIFGPYNKKKPRGEGLKMGKEYITYSSIPIHGSDYDWARLECNRLEDGYYNEEDIKFITFIQDTYKNSQGLKPVKPTEVRGQSVHRPGLKRLYERAILMQKEYSNNEMWDKQIKIYEEQMQWAQKDNYGRVYNYFVVKMRPKIDNSKILPNILSRNNDYDKDWHVDPLFETDDLYNILDTALKKHIIEIGQKFVKNTNIRIDKEEFKHNIDHIIASNEYNCQTMARTVAISRAKPSTKKNPYRLKKRDYNPNTGISIPEDYFDLKKQKPNDILKEDARKLKIQLAKKNEKNTVNFFENFEKKKYWPETTREDYIDSLNHYKGTAIIFSYHIRDLLIKMKKYVFADNNMYMNETKCDQKTFCKLKEWYEHCIAMLVPEMIEFVQNLKPEHGEYDAKPILFKHSEAHKFKKAGPRIRTPRRRRNQGQNPNVQRNQPPVVQRIIDGVEEIANAQQEPINDVVQRIIDDYSAGNTNQLLRLINIMKIPIWKFNNMYPRRTQDINAVKERIKWDFQRWHRRNNRAAWDKIKVLCYLWDNGQRLDNGQRIDNLDVQDPRKTPQGLWFMRCLGYAMQNDSFQPGAWPSNEVDNDQAPDGASVYDVSDFNEEADEWVESRNRLKNITLIALPSILSILHLAFIWDVSVPVEEYDGELILYPGCEWFKKMILSLLSSNGYVPILSEYVQAWFIPPELKLTRSKGDSILSMSGYTNDGYINDKNQVVNTLDIQMKELSELWVRSEPNLDVSLAQLKNMTAKTALHTFSQKNFMSKYRNYMNETVNKYKDTQGVGNDLGMAFFKTTQAAKMLEGQAVLYQTQIDLWEGMLWVCAYVGALFLGYLASGVEVSDNLWRKTFITGINTINYGGIGLFTAGKITFDAFAAPQASNLVKYVATLDRAWYFSSVLIASRVLKALIDDSVEKENEFRVQKYYGVRNEWWDWIYGRSNENDNDNIELDLNIKKSMWDLIRAKTYEFIQISRKFKNIYDNDSVLEKNISLERGRNALIHFDIRYPSFYFKNRELESKSRARNIHYPPGTIFKSKGKDKVEEYIVVDDLQTMYTYPCLKDEDSSNPLDFLKKQFNNFDWDAEPNHWSSYDKFKQLITRYTNQFRLAVLINSKNKKLVLVSVADKNLVKSLTKTSYIASTGVLAMSMMDNTDDLNNTLQSMGLIGLGTLGAFENTQTAVPILGIGMSAYTSCQHTQSSPVKPMPFDMGINFLTLSLGSAWYLYNKKRTVSEERYNRILFSTRMSLLIPLSLSPPEAFENNRMLWGGKLWCPITGRLFYFEQKHDAEMPSGIGKLNNKSEDPIMFFFTDETINREKYKKIEDGFELRETRDGKIELTIYCIVDVNENYERDDVNYDRQVVGRWIYTPSPISKHAWFIKID